MLVAAEPLIPTLVTGAMNLQPQGNADTPVFPSTVKMKRRKISLPQPRTDRFRRESSRGTADTAMVCATFGELRPEADFPAAKKPS